MADAVYSDAKNALFRLEGGVLFGGESGSRLSLSNSGYQLYHVITISPANYIRGNSSSTKRKYLFSSNFQHIS